MQCGLPTAVPGQAGATCLQLQARAMAMTSLAPVPGNPRPEACARRKLRATAMHSSAQPTPIGARLQRLEAASALLSQPAAQWRRQQQRGVRLRPRAMDAMPAWTLDQIAGLAFGGLMVAFYFGAQQVDVFIAKQQRRQLGLCEQCGGLYEPGTCAQAGCPMKAGGGSSAGSSSAGSSSAGGGGTAAGGS